MGTSITTNQWLYFVYLVNKYIYWIFWDMLQNLSFSPQNVMYFIIYFLVHKYSHIIQRLLKFSSRAKELKHWTESNQGITLACLSGENEEIHENSLSRQSYHSQNSNQTYPKCKSVYCLLQTTCLVMPQQMAKFPLMYIKPSLNFVKMSNEDVPESSPTHCWNWECEVGQLSANKYQCISIFQVSLLSFAVTILSTPSQANTFSYAVLQWLTRRNNASAVCGASNSGKLSTNAGNTQSSLQSQCHEEKTDFLEFPSFTEKLAEDCECSHHPSTDSTHKNTEKLCSVINNDQWGTISETAGKLGLSYGKC